MLKYKDYKLIQPDAGQRNRISELIENQDGSVFHEVALNKIVESAFQTELYYLVDNPKNISCFSPIHITKNKFGLKRYHFKPLYDIPYAGFVGIAKIDINELSTGFFGSIKYTGFPYIKDRTHELNDKLNFGETCMIDLSYSEDDIFTQSIHSKRRNMIRKALKSDIYIKEFFTIDGLNEFWPILEGLHKKIGSSRLSYNYYKGLCTNFFPKKQAFILIAYKEKKPISGVFIIGNKNYMHYYKGASLSGIKNEGQGELLQWEAVKISKSLGAKYYDLCNLDKDNLPSIYRFKTGFSNSIYRYPKFTKNKLGFRIINRLNNA